MEKIIKKILIITDNFEDNKDWKEDIIKDGKKGAFPWHEDEGINYFYFDIEIIEEIKPLNKYYDAILVDYGLFDNTQKNYRIVKSFIKNTPIVLWCSALSGDYVINDLKKIRPELSYLRSIDIHDRDRLRIGLYRFFEDEVKKD